MKKIVIINCGGNLLSLIRAIHKVDEKSIITSNLDQIEKATHVFLPGVGSFQRAIDILIKKKLLNVLQNLKLKNTYIMGICLGMQLLLDDSEENGFHKGLGLIEGNVKKINLNPNDKIDKLKIPNIGWHKITKMKNSKIFENINKNFEAYFVHSYFAKLKNQENCIGEIIYGANKIPAIINKKNIYGCQFHPEKSGDAGLQLIKNFLQLN